MRKLLCKLIDALVYRFLVMDAALDHLRKYRIIQ